MPAPPSPATACADYLAALASKIDVVKKPVLPTKDKADKARRRQLMGRACNLPALSWSGSQAMSGAAPRRSQVLTTYAEACQVRNLEFLNATLRGRSIVVRPPPRSRVQKDRERLRRRFAFVHGCCTLNPIPYP